MAAYNKFNNFVQNLCSAIVNMTTSGDTFKTLLTNTAPVATNSVYSDISATEVANGNGYTTGGAASSVTSLTNSSGTTKWIIAQPVWTATGSVGPFRYAALYDSSQVTKTLIAWFDYGSSITLANGDTFTVAYDGTAGVLTIA